MPTNTAQLTRQPLDMDIIESVNKNASNTNMININNKIGQIKGLLAFSSSILGLSISWTDMHDGIKFITSLIAMLAGIFFLGCAVYDRFYKKSKARKRYYISSRKSSNIPNKIFTQEK